MDLETLSRCVHSLGNLYTKLELLNRMVKLQNGTVKPKNGKTLKQNGTG